MVDQGNRFSGQLAGTITAVTGGVAYVTLDGASTAITANIAQMFGVAMQLFTAPGTRVFGVMIGRQFWVTSVVNKNLYGGAVSGSIVGGWPIGVPSATTGTAFSLPGGQFRCSVSCTSFDAGGAAGAAVELYLDGVLKDTMLIRPAVPAGQRFTLPTGVLSTLINAGTHYVALRQTIGSSNTDDRASIFGHVLPV